MNASRAAAVVRTAWTRASSSRPQQSWSIARNTDRVLSSLGAELYWTDRLDENNVIDTRAILWSVAAALSGNAAKSAHCTVDSSSSLPLSAGSA